MDADKRLSVSSRVKACTECRQHKLRCDAAKDHSVPCSRCRRRGLHCEITTAFRRVKRRTKRELQAELESLRQQVESHGSTPAAYPVASSTPRQAHTDGSTGGNSAGLYQQMPSSVLTPASITHTNNASTDLGLNGHDSRDRSDMSIGALSSMPTLPRAAAGMEIGPDTIDHCFQLFQQRYLQHCPIFEGRLRPNITYLQSELLFWTVVAVGARRFEDDPTLLTSLEPHIVDLASKSILSRENPLPTIKALILLCAWPLPHDSLQKDISPMLAGALLQHALSIGLHIYGVGQDFSRTKIAVDRAQIQYRRRLWFTCVTVCQRVSCTSGLPPPLVPDTYNRMHHGKDTNSSLPASVTFEKTLSTVQTEGVMQLERHSLATPPDQRVAVLNPLIDSFSQQILELSPECPSELGTFYLEAAQLQILCFHLFVPRDSLDDTKLWRMYELACLCIETAQRAEAEQGLSDCSPIFISKYLDMAAFTILKISRCHLRQSLDLERGRRAYFFVISFSRNVSVESGDIMNRAEGILTQLWASKNIFKQPDGSYDSLTLRCGSRLAMSVAYDCFWWWRSEFGGQQNPYEDGQSPTTEASVEQSQGAIASPAPPSIPSSYSYDDYAALDVTFPESQWATTQDLMSLDWSQFQYEPMLPFMDMQNNPEVFDPNAMYVPNPMPLPQA